MKTRKHLNWTAIATRDSNNCTARLRPCPCLRSSFPLALGTPRGRPVPVLIHLINMLRHRRVEWAAMEFLLREPAETPHLDHPEATAAPAAADRWPWPPWCSWWPSRCCADQWGSLLGNARRTTSCSLDDSFSMSDRWGDTTAFDQAKAVIERIGAAAARQTQPQTFTLLRFSPGRRPGAPRSPTC